MAMIITVGHTVLESPYSVVEFFPIFFFFFFANKVFRMDDYLRRGRRWTSGTKRM